MMLQLMNYIIKGVLRKIFTQYLNIYDNKFDLESGVIKLPRGNINHDTINDKLTLLNIRITSSSYKNLIIHIPIIEIMSKPIRISIEVLDIVIEKVYPNEPPSGRQSQSSQQEGSVASDQEQSPTKDVPSDQPGQRSEGKQKGYFRNIINRLLYNMQIYMQKINIRLIDSREEQLFRQASFTLNSLNLKNSLVLLEANIIKKAFTLSQLHLRHTIGELLIKDLNICLDFSHLKLNVIAVLGSISIEVYNIPFKEIIRSMTKKQMQRSTDKETVSQNQLQMSVYLKLNSSKIISKLARIEASSMELKMFQGREKQELVLTFQKILISNNASQRQEQSMIAIKYLPFSKQVKIYSQYEDSIIKHCFAHVKRHSEGSTTRNAVKVYHLLIDVSINEFKHLLDNVMNYSREINYVKRILNKMKSQASTKQTIQQKKEGNQLIDVLVYRIMLKLNYGSVQAKVFGSARLTTSPQPKKIKKEVPPLKRKRSSQKRQQIAMVEKQKGDAQTRVTGLKVYQFGVKILNYNILQLNELELQYSPQQIVVNGTNIVVEISLSLVDSVRGQVANGDRDIAYYRQKFKDICQRRDPNLQKRPSDGPKDNPISNVQIKQEQGQVEGVSLLKELERIKIYLKMNEVALRIGELRQQRFYEQSDSKKQNRKAKTEQVFISIVEIELINSLVSLISNKVKARTDLIAYLTSPYTLERTPLTNQLQLSLTCHLITQQLNINFKNNFIILLQDQFINVFYKLLDKKNIWCNFRNLTHERVTFIQSTDEHVPLLSDQNGGENKEDKQTFYFRIDLEPFKTRNLFWLDDQSFRLEVGKRMSSPIFLNKIDQLHETAGSNEWWAYQTDRELHLSDDSQYEYLLKFMFNKLGNLCEIILDYKVHIHSYSQQYFVHVENQRYEIETNSAQIVSPSITHSSQGHWFHHLDQFLEQYPRFTLQSANRMHRIDSLMVNEQFVLLGLYKIEPQEKQNASKLYESYILQSRHLKSVRYSIMPFLILTNCLDCSVEVEITDKKSQQRQKVVVKSAESRCLSCNEKFDYYLKQFTIKVSLLGREDKILFQSQSIYFNTFFMVDRATETPVQLRSTAQKNYSKRLIVFEQSLLLKTKLITLRSGIQLCNRTPFSFIFKARDVNRLTEEVEIILAAEQTKEWTYRLKKDTILLIHINQQMENRIEVRYGQLRSAKILSFNFCKVNDKFYNILVRGQARLVNGVEIIELQPFIELVNLCQHIPSLKIEDYLELAYDKRTSLPLNATSLNKYNNRAVDIDDLNKIYAQIFLTSKVTDQPLSLSLGDQFVSLAELIRLSSQQIVSKGNRYIFTLLKDMNGNRITFYLTDRLYNQQAHYTVFDNQTAHYFLLTDDAEYAPHFTTEEQPRTMPLQKVVVPKQSFNCLLNRQNYDILLCDQFQKHLQKLSKQTLDKLGLRLHQHSFQTVTVIEAKQQQQRSQVRQQLSTKGLQLRVKMFGKMEMSFGVKGLTLRLLEKGKLDCLIQDISIKNEQTKDHLLRIPEETYLLVEGGRLHDGHFWLVKNLFVKCKNVIVNIRRQMPYSFINMVNHLTERMGFNIPEDQPSIDPRKYRQKVRKLNGELKLRKYVSETLLLLRNVCIHEIHLSLTIQLQNLSFSNVIILPHFQLLSRFMRSKSFKQELVTYYLTNLLAKFPKLAFMMSNFKSPLNTIRLFFNLREAMKEKIENKPIITFPAAAIPDNPFLFSLQRWNVIYNRLAHAKCGQIQQKFISFLYQNKRYLLVTNLHVLWVEEGEFRSFELRELESAKVTKNRMNSQLVLRFKRGQRLILVDEHKRCIRILDNIQQLLL